MVPKTTFLLSLQGTDDTVLSISIVFKPCDMKELLKARLELELRYAEEREKFEETTFYSRKKFAKEIAGLKEIVDELYELDKMIATQTRNIRYGVLDDYLDYAR